VVVRVGEEEVEVKWVMVEGEVEEVRRWVRLGGVVVDWYSG
jgi:hypothetical protein